MLGRATFSVKMDCVAAAVLMPPLVAAESSHTRSKKVRASLDDLYARLEETELQARRL